MNKDNLGWILGNDSCSVHILSYSHLLYLFRPAADALTRVLITGLDSMIHVALHIELMFIQLIQKTKLWERVGHHTATLSRTSMLL